MEWTVVVNPTAGRGRTRKLLPSLTHRCEQLGIAVEVPSSLDAGLEAARAAFARGHGVLACGGDGTVSHLASLASEVDGVLGIVPTGAGNDFARHLGIDHRRPVDALMLVEHGRIGRADLGRVTTADGTEARFTTVANTGFDSEANRWANSVRWATGTALYVLAVLRTLAVYRPQPLRVWVDDTEWSGNTWLVAVGNSRYYAGGMMITPGAEVDDGELDVCIIGPASRSEFLVRFPGVFRGRHVTMRDVTMLRGTSIQIDAQPGSGGGTSTLDLWAAGERVGTLPARLTLLPGALRVLVPSSAPVA
jgi:diacylglycerol kinase (ATP)